MMEIRAQQTSKLAKAEEKIELFVNELQDLSKREQEQKQANDIQRLQADIAEREEKLADAEKEVIGFGECTSFSRNFAKCNLAAVGFEPTPPKRLVP